jgi:hypothetical protein
MRICLCIHPNLLQGAGKGARCFPLSYRDVTRNNCTNIYSMLLPDCTPVVLYLW